MFKGERLRYCAVCRRRRFKLMPSEAGVFQVIGPWPEYERALVRLAQGDERCSHHVQGTPVFIGDQARFQAVLSSAEILPSYVKIATQNYPDKA